jgi:hypothetical protein
VNLESFNLLHVQAVSDSWEDIVGVPVVSLFASKDSQLCECEFVLSASLDSRLVNDLDLELVLDVSLTWTDLIRSWNDWRDFEANRIDGLSR